MSALALFCSICKSDIAINAPRLIHTPSNKSDETANHIFHKQCLLDWFRVSSTCPTCREPITVSRRIKLLRAYDLGIATGKFLLVFIWQASVGLLITLMAKSVPKVGGHFFEAIEVGSLAVVAGIAVVACGKKISQLVGKEIPMLPEVFGTFATILVSLPGMRNGMIHLPGALLGALVVDRGVALVTSITKRTMLVSATAIGCWAGHVIRLLNLQDEGTAFVIMAAFQTGLTLLFLTGQ